MKRIISIMISAVIIITMIPVFASAVSGSFTGPSTVRAGDTITLTFSVSDSGLEGYSGSLSYDSSVVTLQSVTSKSGGSWSFTRNGNNIVAYDSSGTSPAKTLFAATFKVNSGVASGTKVEISFSGDFNVSGTESSMTRTYSSTLAAPLSNDATLKSLTVANAKLSPSFNANTTSYSCGTVPFETAKLSVSAVANAEGAKVYVNGSSLSVGKNTVKITVTAPSGTQKTYSITVTREQDPNYVASTNTDLSGITPSYGQLSPEFKVDNKEYVIYVPYEITTFSLAASAADPLAQGAEGVENAQLKVGLNELKIKCIAEDGSEGIYTVYVVRMNEYGGVDSLLIPVVGEEVTEPEVTEPVSNVDDGMKDISDMGFSPLLAAIFALIALVFGLVIGMLIMKIKYTSSDDNDDNDSASGGDFDVEGPSEYADYYTQTNSADYSHYTEPDINNYLND